MSSVEKMLKNQDIKYFLIPTIVKAKVAEGGFACIYRATSETTQETYAIKRLLSNDNERRQEGIREATLLRKMNHKNIVKFITG